MQAVKTGAALKAWVKKVKDGGQEMATNILSYLTAWMKKVVKSKVAAKKWPQTF